MNVAILFTQAYDYKSVMHYPNWAFSSNGQPTITAIGNVNMRLGGDTLSETDKKELRMYFGCPAGKDDYFCK